MKMIRQKGFSKKLNQVLKTTNNPRLIQLKDDDIYLLITEFWKLLADLLKEGIYISFEGAMSFFTKPIKRACRNARTGEKWFTYKKRVRVKVIDPFRKKSEVEITEAEHAEFIAKKKK